MPFSKTRKIIQRGTRANQPLASSVQEGTLYYVTDEDKVERSNGSTWDSYGNAFLIGGSNTQVQFNDSGVLGGDAGLTYDKTTDILSSIGGYKERSRTTPLGEWISVTYSAGNFTANGSMTWTVDSGDQQTYAYMLVGKTMILAFSIVTTTVGGVANNRLQLAIPGGFSAKNEAWVPYRLTNPAAASSFCRVSASATIVELFRDASAGNWTLGTDDTNVMGTITFEVL